MKATVFTCLLCTAFLGVDWSSVFQSIPFLSHPNSDATFPTTHNRSYLLGIYLAVLALNFLYPASQRFSQETRRKLFAGLSITINIGILAAFKYFNFFTESLSQGWESLFGTPIGFTTTNIILPVGISFYTFQTMSYTIDVYRKQLKPCSSLLEFAAYVSFFPQLVAGPIERACNLIPQFQKPRKLPRYQVYEGLWLIVWGFYKKLVIADNLAPLVNSLFTQVETGSTPVSGINMLIAVYGFALQIYCDFSGYTDIARGISKLLGFELMLNFKLPYLSRSPSEFWQRWHISLSSWLRDYLYIPLGGNRRGAYFTYRNLMITMTLGGLWHGASLNFVIWGIYQGAILIGYRIVAPQLDQTKYSPLAMFAQWFLMFQFTCFGWLLFRVTDMEVVPRMIAEIVTNFTSNPDVLRNLQSLSFYAVPLVAMQFWQAYTNNLTPIHRSRTFTQVNVLLFVFFSLLVFSAQGGSDFIYFAF